VGYVMEGTRAKAAELRRVIVRAVAADPGAGGAWRKAGAGPGTRRLARGSMMPWVARRM
jgi:hypothetical protein